MAALSVFWLVEQPQGSMMAYHPCFQHILRALNVHRHRLCMGDYNAPSEKPTWLYASAWSEQGPTYPDIITT